jgi:hypothetical protein
MAKPPSGLSAVQDFFAALPASRDLKGGRVFAAGVVQQGKSTKSRQTWLITNVGSRNRKLTVKNISAGFDEFTKWHLSRLVVSYDTQAEAIEAASNTKVVVERPPLDRLYSASEELAQQVASHADAVERRGDEIDAMLAQIRANISDLSIP